MIRRTELSTGRIRLEPIGPHHAEQMWAATEVSLPELQSWMVWAASASPETTAAFCHEARSDWEEARAYQFAMMEEGWIAGAIGIDTPSPIHRMGELGYWVRTDLAGGGRATEAAREVLRFGFEQIGLYRIELRAGVKNLPSRRVAEKLGFTREGRMHKGCPGGREPYDCLLYGLLAEDFRPTE